MKEEISQLPDGQVRRQVGRSLWPLPLLVVAEHLRRIIAALLERDAFQLGGAGLHLACDVVVRLSKLLGVPADVLRVLRCGALAGCCFERNSPLYIGHGQVVADTESVGFGVGDGIQCLALVGPKITYATGRSGGSLSYSFALASHHHHVARNTVGCCLSSAAIPRGAARRADVLRLLSEQPLGFGGLPTPPT
ncbi:hypothetical protein [Mycolicibacterium doricum]|uniref:hypothetical protein n=1 Tax=Mycolicibacterium doricum TaxID=126673 RepID=UPI0013CF55FC|nr:hypothetical protein [Mycolicibacterium doricum]